MSFLNQLKSKASALQTVQSVQQTQDAASLLATEAAAKTTWLYMADLARRLEVIQPDGPALSLNNKTHWAPMKLTGFRANSRKKKINDKEVFDYVTMAWNIVPRVGAPVPDSVTITADHQNAKLAFRLANTSGFAVENAVYPAGRVQSDVLDELAKLIVGRPNRFA